MYVDLGFLLIMYAFSCIAVGVSLYALWTLKELENYYRSKKTNVRQRPVPPATTKKTKGHHWG